MDSRSTYLVLRYISPRHSVAPGAVTSVLIFSPSYIQEHFSWSGLGPAAPPAPIPAAARSAASRLLFVSGSSGPPTTYRCSRSSRRKSERPTFPPPLSESPPLLKLTNPSAKPQESAYASLPTAIPSLRGLRPISPSKNSVMSLWPLPM